MKAIETQFAEYGAFHRDARNELTHAIGIPLIVLSIVMWAGNLRLVDLAGATIDLAWLLIGAVTVFYMALNVPLGIVMLIVLALLHVLGVSVLGANAWIALGLFVVGWALQFVGHSFEGKRPAFLQNGVHLLVGPLWILDRALARFGMSPVGHEAR